MAREKKKSRFRLDIVLIICFFILLFSVSFYMINTDLDSVLEKEYGGPIVTHNYDNDSSE